MSTEVDHRPASVVHPRTGEVLDLSAPDEDLASYLDELAQLKSVLEEHRRMVNREIVRRLDLSAKWTRHAGPFKLSAASPQPTEEWDGGDLRERLLPLVDAGTLSIEALDAAVEVVVDYKVKKAGINALRKLGGDVEAAITELRYERPRGERNVRVERPLHG